MNKLIQKVAVGAMALACLSMVGVTTAASGDTTTTVAPTTTTSLVPLQGSANLPVGIAVDTVIASSSKNIQYPLAGCAMTNEFITGQTVVFRMWGQMTDSGAPLTNLNVASATITIPGVSTPISLAFGPHDPYFTGSWSTTGYPTGVVAFTLTLVTDTVPAVTQQETSTVPTVVAYKAKVKVGGKSLTITKYKVVNKTVTTTVTVTPAQGEQTYTYTQAGLPDPLTINPLN